MYSDYIKINEQFKNSVNIEYDLMDSNKLAEYIPTEDICEVMNYYIDSVLDPKFNRSTLLEGPYGKGKSYLVLALTQIFALDLNSDEYCTFLNKLKNTNLDLYSKIIRIKEKNFKLLPVIINGNYSDLKQALNIALKESLQSVNLDNLYPDTAYEVCLRVISQWEKDKELQESIVSKCMTVTKTDLNSIKKGLQNYSQESLKKFTKLYNCVVKGLEFNPFTNDDVIKNYRDITHKLTQNGYNGLFIIFDEFSKFIDSDNENIMRDLKVLQDLAEAVSRSSKEEQMHLCCITHKSLESYYRNKKETVANAFRTVEGRFKEIRFNRSMNQNYEIISFSIQKENGFNEMYQKQIDKNSDFYSALKKLDVFSDINKEILFKGCFPLNPLTTYAVINISEKIAQNERTLFTFISDNDTNSLSTFIKNHDNGLFNVNKIFDYFMNMLEKADDEEVRKIYYKTTACLLKTGDLLSKKIIKVISIIDIIGNNSLFANKEIISLCLNEEVDIVLEKLNSLKEEKLLKLNAYDDTYEFAGAGSKIIDTKVDSYVLKHGKEENISASLNSLFDSNFVLPRKYNTKHKMTRFYREKYISDFELLSLNSFNPLFKDFCDGIVLRVLKTRKNNNVEIKEHFKTMKNNQTVILKLLEEPITNKISNEIFRVEGLKNTTVEDELIKSEKELLYKEELNQLEIYLDNLFDSENVELESVCTTKVYFELLSELMEKVYSATPIINNEMLNMEVGISSNYIKARNKVINLYLEKKIKQDIDNLEGFSVSSPENTVFISAKEKNTKEKRDVLNVIKSSLTKAEGEKISSEYLVNELKASPYGIRLGVMPLLIAMAIDELDENIVLYYDKREIDLTADNLSKMTLNPTKYYFLMEKGSKEKSTYLNDLLDVFNLSSTNNYRDDIKQIVKYLNNWFLSQPKIIRSANLKNNYIDIEENFIRIKDIFSALIINEHEALFEKLPSLFDYDYSSVIKYIENLNEQVDETLSHYSKELIDSIKNEFNSDLRSSLYNVIKDWIQLNKADKKLLEDDEKNFISLFEQKNYNDNALLNEISKSILNIKLTDWDCDNSGKILSFIRILTNEMDSKKMIEDVISNKNNEFVNQEQIEVSPMGQMLLDNIESVIDEFGESITNEEKINILKGLINKML